MTTTEGKNFGFKVKAVDFTKMPKGRGVRLGKIKPPITSVPEPEIEPIFPGEYRVAPVLQGEVLSHGLAKLEKQN